jgi:hypothetical protein
LHRKGDHSCMSTPESFCQLTNLPADTLNQEENMLLEIELFHHIITELKSIFIDHHKDYFRLLKYTQEMENSMIETNFIRYILKDFSYRRIFTDRNFLLYSNSRRSDF